MRTQAIAAVWWSQRRCWPWESHRWQPAGTTAGYGYQTATVVTPVAVRRPVAAAAVVRRNYGYGGRAVVPRVGSGARIGRTGPGNRGLGR